VGEAKKDRIALSIYGKAGKLLGRWKCADDWLLMLIVYCAGRVRDRGELIPVDSRWHPWGKTRASHSHEPASVHTSEPSCSGEGAAPKNAGTYQDPLTPGWGVTAQRIGKPFERKSSRSYIIILDIEI
jgi:hypothetical protein